MRRADFFRARAEVNAWNEKYPPGTLVTVELRDGGTMVSTTFSYAFREGNLGRVWIDGFLKPVSLTALTPIGRE